MTFGCTLQVTGTLPSVSARAFIASYNETSRAQHYQQYQSLLEQYFQNQIEKNANQMNVNMKSKSFTMIISDAISLYRRNIGFGVNLSQTSFGDNLSSSYLNKYSSLL